MVCVSTNLSHQKPTIHVGKYTIPMDLTVDGSEILVPALGCKNYPGNNGNFATSVATSTGGFLARFLPSSLVALGFPWIKIAPVDPTGEATAKLNWWKILQP